MLILPALMFLLLHPVHETVTEVQWNPKTSSVEVAIRLDALDEEWIDKQTKPAETSKQEWRIDYLRRRLRVSPLPTAMPSPLPTASAADDAPKPNLTPDDRYRWIGRQTEGAHVWWYVAITPASGKAPEWIDIQLLLDRNANYQHRVLFLDENPKRSEDLNRKKTKATFAITPAIEAANNE